MIAVFARMRDVWRRWRHRGVNDQILEEFRHHLDLRAAELQRRGLPPGEAARQARLEFGGTERYRLEAREALGLRLFDEMSGDLRHTIRSFARSPMFTVAAALTLALGIGVNAAVFSLLNASVLRPLPFPQPERLVVLQQTHSEPGAPPRSFRWWSYPQFAALHPRVTTLSHLSAYWAADANLSGDGMQPRRVRTEVVSASYFSLLGVNPVLGRAFDVKDDAASSPVVVLGHDLWAQQFAAEPRVLGRQIVLNGIPLTVVGVAAQGFRGLTGEADLWMPHAAAPAVHLPNYLTSDQYFLRIVGRVASRIPIEQARAEAALTAAAVADAVRREGGAEAWDGQWGAELLPLEAARRDPRTTRAQFVLAGAALFVLLIAVVNVAGLQLARATTRQREIAMRAALGAGRLRILRLGAVEGSVLGLLGGTAGVLFAAWCIPVLIEVAPEYLGGARARLSVAGLDSFAAPEFDWRVLVFGGALAFAAGILAGVVPAVRAVRAHLTPELKAGARGSTLGVGSLRRPTMLSAAAILQVAGAVVLLVAAALLLQALHRLSATAPGFDPDGVVSFRISPAATAYGGNAAASLLERVLEAVHTVPGVQSATVGYTPYSGSATTTVEVVGRPPSAQPLVVGRHYVGPDHFQTLRIPLLSGRTLTADDRTGRPTVAIINETAARRLFPGEDPLGKRVRLGAGLWFDAANDPNVTTEIVGVVGDVLYTAPGGEVRPDFYTSYLQFARPSTTVMVRTAGDPLRLVPALRTALAGVDSTLALHDLRTMRERAAEALSSERFATAAVGSLAGLGLLLAAIGIYGVMAYSVMQRQREIGIQLALGATPFHVVRRIVGQGAALTAVGLLIGSAAALAVSRALPALIADVSSLDPAVFAGVTSLLLLMALAACYLPARVATRINPVAAIAAE